jgi:hypothetical protein
VKIAQITKETLDAIQISQAAERRSDAIFLCSVSGSVDLLADGLGYGIDLGWARSPSNDLRRRKYYARLHLARLPWWVLTWDQSPGSREDHNRG